jgi:thiamine transporter ThiT
MHLRITLRVVCWSQCIFPLGVIPGVILRLISGVILGLITGVILGLITGVTLRHSVGGEPVRL